ncbi:RNA polymerase sigma factor [Streptomyces sp. IBSNAI002]|uniref:RNA polymerase sigma factor n=1 Tax=Streptomyces sp. IBSNAI002 TaxID=3457500 RepID=UPI003FD5972B
MTSARSRARLPQPPGERENCDRVRAGDRAAFEQVWRDHRAAVARYAERLGCRAPYEVDDLVSDTFASTLRALLGGRGPLGDVRPYLFSVARSHHQRRSARNRREYPVANIGEHVGERAGFGEQGGAGAEADEAAELLSALAPAHRQVLRMRYLEGQSVPDMSVRLGVSTTVVSSRLYRARRAMRQARGAHRAMLQARSDGRPGFAAPVREG